MSIDRLQLWHSNRPGSGVPGPPLIPIIMGPPLPIGGPALMDATSKEGCPFDVCAYAAPQRNPMKTIPNRSILNH
jgi:hypothetical protein